MKDRFPEEIANTYKKEALEAYIQYEDIKGSLDYKLKYRLYSEFSNWKNILLKTPFADPSLLNSVEQISDSLETNIKKEWNITTPISPYLNIKREDLTKPTIILTGSLAKVLVAFGVLSHQKPSALIERLRATAIRYIMFPSTKAKKNTVKKQTSLKTKIQQKVLVHFLMGEKDKDKVRGNIRGKSRAIGRIFNISKDTARRWYDEAAKMPEYEREAILFELFGFRSRRNKDTMELHHKGRRSFSSIDKVEDNIPDKIDSKIDLNDKSRRSFSNLDEYDRTDDSDIEQ